MNLRFLLLLLAFFASAQLAHSYSSPIPISASNHTQVSSQYEKRWDRWNHDDDLNCRDLWDQWCRNNCWDYNPNLYGSGGGGSGGGYASPPSGNGRYQSPGANGFPQNGNGGRGGYDPAWPGGKDHECYRRCYSHCDNRYECAAAPALSVLFAFLTPLLLVFILSE
ncbi:hypothetical protein MVEG_08073 [Podila verticillata NRRL 6337]|nr:MAG: hypothetical protein BYD32DRAFT_455396 [Podila humilis]KFH65971.1 hypothetical protein MVEG_08073 [Podila verticillata NRRL 6337]